MEYDKEHGERPSKSQLKREMTALQHLGERLVELPPQHLAQFDLPANLREAVDAARATRAHGARRRQLQYVGRLMREVDPAPIRAAFARIDGADHAERALQHRAERWRTRLLDDGDDALTAFLSEHPGADRQHLRRLVRDAVAERSAGRPPRHQRELFREIRAAIST